MKEINSFTWISKMDDSKSFVSFIIVQESYRNRVLDVNVYRSAGGGVSYHFLVETIIRKEARWVGG